MGSCWVLVGSVLWPPILYRVYASLAFFAGSRLGAHEKTPGFVYVTVND